MKTLVLDTSGWVFSSKLGINKLLEKGFKLIIPIEVLNETEKGIELGYRDAYVRKELMDSGKLVVVEAQKDIVDKIRKETGLRQLGDLEVLALALSEKGIVYSDDSHLETACVLLDIPIVSTAAMLIHLYKKKLIQEGNVQLLLDLLETFGYSSKKINESRRIIGGEKNG